MFSLCVSVPFAFVVVKDDHGDDSDAILQQLRDLVAIRIAKFAIPEHFLVRVIFKFTPQPIRAQLVPLVTVRFFLSGGEAVTEDSLWEDHETDPEEDRYGNGW